MTALFEESYDTIAQFIGAPGRASIALYRNTTEAINAVMYSLLTEFRDGDNVVTTMMEHNSNYVPWYAMCREILPRLGRRVEYRLARFDPGTGELDLDHLASLIDARTKLVCCTGASNFLGTRHPLAAVRALADASGYRQPERRAALLPAGRRAPSWCRARSSTCRRSASTTWRSPSTSCWRRSGSACCTPGSTCSAASLPFLYGGDMIAEGRVFPGQVEYNALPWKYAAGTPNILGAIVSAQALRLLLDLALTPDRPAYFGTARPLDRAAVRAAMDRVCRLEPAADQPGAGRPGRHRRDHHLRSPRPGPAHLAGRVQPGGPRPRQRGRGPEPGRGGVTRRLPLRDARPPRARADPARELPPELLPLQHPGRSRPGRGRGRGHRRRPPRVRGIPVRVPDARTGLAVGSGDIAMTVPTATCRCRRCACLPAGSGVASAGQGQSRLSASERGDSSFAALALGDTWCAANPR